MYALFDRFAERYDLHTPPHHYQHDHAFVLNVAAALGTPCRMLDVGCGTGVLVEKALAIGVLAKGVDASESMVRIAQRRVGEHASVRRMQEIDYEEAFDLIVSMSWSLNYAADEDELRGVLRRMYRALRPAGQVVVQVAHATHMDRVQMVDHEMGPSGAQGDVVFTYRFVPLDREGLELRAEYDYSCTSTGEHLREDHLLRVTDAHAVARDMREIGFVDVQIYDSWRRDPFRKSVSPFVTGVRGH